MTISEFAGVLPGLHERRDGVRYTVLTTANHITPMWWGELDRRRLHEHEDTGQRRRRGDYKVLTLEPTSRRDA